MLTARRPGTNSEFRRFPKQICVIDVAQQRIVNRIAAGHTAMAPVLSPDHQRLYVCNRFDNDVSVIDLTTRRELKRIRVEREPVAGAVTPNWRWLVVANHLHDGSAVSLREVLTTANHDDRHGRTSGLASQEIDDLVEYLLTL